MALTTDEDFLVWQIRQTFSKVADTSSERFIAFPEEYDSEYILAALGKQLSSRHSSLNPVNAQRNAIRAAELSKITLQGPLPPLPGFSKDISRSVHQSNLLKKKRSATVTKKEKEPITNRSAKLLDVSIEELIGAIGSNGRTPPPTKKLPNVAQVLLEGGRGKGASSHGSEEGIAATLTEQNGFLEESSSTSSLNILKVENKVVPSKKKDSSLRVSNDVNDEERQKILFANIASSSIMANKPILGKDLGSSLSNDNLIDGNRELNQDEEIDDAEFDSSKDIDSKTGNDDKIQGKLSKKESSLSLSENNRSVASAKRISNMYGDEDEDGDYYHDVFEEVDKEKEQEEKEKRNKLERSKVLEETKDSQVKIEQKQTQQKTIYLQQEKNTGNNDNKQRMTEPVKEAKLTLEEKANKINTQSTLVIKKLPIELNKLPLSKSSQDSSNKESEKHSILSNLLINQTDNTNPLKKYSRIYGKKDSKSIFFNIYLPWSNKPKVPLRINVIADATVEDIIGYTLYVYNSEKLDPILPEDLWNLNLWAIRIVEDDFEIDEDFPALERMRQIKRFSFDSFALCEMQPNVVRNMIDSTSKKDGANLISKSVGSDQPMSLPEDIAMSSRISSVLSPLSNKGVLSPSNFSNQGTNVFLKVHLYSTIEVKQTTTFLAQSQQKMSEVFENICKKHKYDSNKYVMKMPDIKTDVPMDATLDSLNIAEFCILKRAGAGAGDIFLRPDDETGESGAELGVIIEPDEYTSMYKQYQVNQKTFMRLQNRQLTIDGDYIHLLSGHDSRNFFDASKTQSYPASAVISCKLIKSGGTSFKLIVVGNKGDDKIKTYDLDANNPTEANEICTRITFLTQMNKQT